MCPSVWLSSYLLPLYKGKGPLSEPDSYRGVVLKSVVLKLHTYILNHRIGNWAETEGVIPDRRSTLPRGQRENVVGLLHSGMRRSRFKPRAGNNILFHFYCLRLTRLTFNKS